MKTPSTTTIGIDLGDKKHAICVIDASGTIIDERSITNHRESLRRLAKKYPKARVALERARIASVRSSLIPVPGEVLRAHTYRWQGAQERERGKSDTCVVFGGQGSMEPIVSMGGGNSPRWGMNGPGKYDGLSYLGERGLSRSRTKVRVPGGR
jgi:hypothetical protein